ncbi:anti-sigma factor [Nocardioides sp. SYSU D00038]|uniref:anti-sigma factor n=1 Tax=Nocardioides sp. SYSU D00038 TaxID=2812554 RepID=UPI0019689DC8|nr:anti-sigma factor [Nocardioides sp. SYSU D00038]
MTTGPGGSSDALNADDVELRLPADSVYVAVLRTTAVGLAARVDFTLDDIEDLRMAVGEACALVLPAAAPGGDLVARFGLFPGRLRVEVSVPAGAPVRPDQDSFAWQVLTTLADDVTSYAADDDRFTIALTMVSTLVATDPDVGA